MAIIATMSVSILTPQANAEFEEEQNIAVTGALVPHGGFIVPIGQPSFNLARRDRVIRWRRPARGLSWLRTR
jgi:hypothetical protein